MRQQILLNPCCIFMLIVNPNVAALRRVLPLGAAGFNAIVENYCKYSVLFTTTSKTSSSCRLLRFLFLFFYYFLLDLSRTYEFCMPQQPRASDYQLEPLPWTNLAHFCSPYSKLTSGQSRLMCAVVVFTVQSPHKLWIFFSSTCWILVTN